MVWVPAVKAKERWAPVAASRTACHCHPAVTGKSQRNSAPLSTDTKKELEPSCGARVRPQNQYVPAWLMVNDSVTLPTLPWELEI